MPENKTTATPTTAADASRIQSHAAKSDSNHGFAARAQSAAARNANRGAGGGGQPSGARNSGGGRRR